MSLDPGFIWTAFLQLLSAIPTTLYITVVSVSCGFVIGTVTALFRMRRIPVLSQLSTAYVTFIRGTPMLTHLLLFYFGLPVIVDGLSALLDLGWNSAKIPMIAFAFISFSITSGAYMSEVVRFGLQAVDRGQLEAAWSVGMTTAQALRRIVFPQAFAASLPNLSNSVIGMLHGSTLAFTVSVVDLNAKAQIIASSNWKYFEAYLAAAVIFWGLTILIERITGMIERRINIYRKGGVA
jgi:L-cystine transport system permease protein